MNAGAGRFDGALLIVRLNWPFYAIAAAVIIGWPLWQRSLGGAGFVAVGWVIWAITLWWAAASIAASHWVYDRSRLRTTGWIGQLLPRSPRRWMNIHAGFDQHTAGLRRMFPDSRGISIDVYDRVRMTEPAIRRARKRYPAGAVVAGHAELPAAGGCTDAVFLLFAAHELRTPSSREELFREVARVLDPAGRVVIAEHGRDAYNAAAYGPGAWHFLPYEEWRRLARSAGLVIERETAITPFVRVWSLRKG